MTDVFVFIIVLFIAIRTFSYGMWTFSNKNIKGGVFVIFLSALTSFLSFYILIFDRT